MTSLVSYYSTYSYIRRIDYQPIFKFMIQEPEFYINTYGVSVADGTKSTTLLGDGAFNVLNKNSNPVFFGGAVVSSIRFRNENAYSTTQLSIRLSSTVRRDTDYRYDDYLVTFRGSQIGTLTINTPLKYDTTGTTKLYPFQSVELGATYTVANVNKMGIQYFGFSKINKTRAIGTLDITLNINTLTDDQVKNTLTDTMVISINCINTGYVPTSSLLLLTA